ncbi:MAG: hypothetical protein AAGF75_00185 [Cyanobacteria bacterium P01_H01_bin.130]
MRLLPSTLIIGLLLSAGAAFTGTLPAQATLPQLQETASVEAPVSTTEARRRYRRRTRTAHRGSGRRQMIRHIL